MATWNRVAETMPRDALEELQRSRLARAGRRADAPPAELHVDWSDPDAPRFLPAGKADLLAEAECLSRAFAMAGLEPGDAFLIAESLDRSPDGLALYQGCRKFGLCAIPMGGEPPERLAAVASGRRVRGIYAAPQTLRLWPAKDAASRLLKAVFTSARGLAGGLRGEFESKFGAPLFALHGLAETGGVGTVGAECRFHDGFHVWEDMFVAEVVDHATGAPVAEGDAGELVLTSLVRSAGQLSRWRTGDRVRLVSREKCACGRTSMRVELA